LKKYAHDPKGNKITFESSWHAYWVNGEKYVSATTLLKDFFPKFDREGISERYAAKHGLTQQEVLAKWDAKGKAARDFGNLVHDYVDRKFRGLKIPTALDEKQTKYFKSIEDCISILEDKYEILETEKIIFSTTHKISGTVDLVMRCKSKGDIVIADWKTCEEISMYNQWQKGLQHLDHLTDCNYVHYALQLNLYKRMLQVENYYPKAHDIRMGILHVNAIETKPYKINDMPEEIDGIVNGRC